MTDNELLNSRLERLPSFETDPFGAFLRIRIIIFPKLTLMLRNARCACLEASGHKAVFKAAC
jgi:hypothetical protein